MAKRGGLVGHIREFGDNDRGRCRKRKAEASDEPDANKSVDHGVKLGEFVALNAPCKKFVRTISGGRVPVREREIMNQSSFQRESHPVGGDHQKNSQPLHNVHFEKPDEFGIEDDGQYETTLRKAKFWTKIFPGIRKQTPAEVPKKESKSKVPRFFLTYAIARHVGLKSSIFIKIRSLLVYMFFMLFLTFMSFGAFSSETYHFTKIVSSVFCDCTFYCSGRAGTLDTVRSLEETLCYIEFCFKPGINNGLWGKAGVDPGIQLLTVPRLRQLRVVGHRCLLKLNNEEEECYGSFSEESESETTYGPGSEGFVYSPSKDSPIQFPGYYATYTNNGFSFLISRFNESYAYLPSPEWIDKSTRAVFIDFVLYSPDTLLFCVVQFVFEMPATGLVRPSHYSRAASLMRYHSRYGHYVLFAELMVVFINCLTTVEVLTDMWFFKYLYLLTFGGWYDLLMMSLCYYVGYSLVRRQGAVMEFFTARLFKDDFVDFHPVLTEHVHCTIMIAVLFFFSSFKIYRFLSFDLMEHLRITIQTSIKDIVVFVLVFTIVLWAFVQVANLLFGRTLEKYRSFASTFSELTRVMLGDLDYKGPMLIHNVIGPIFILTYVIFAVFVLISMFFAIINSTFTIVSNIVDIESESYCGFVGHCCQKIRSKCYELRGQRAPPKAGGRKRKNSERIRDLLLDSGYSDVEIKLFFCRYIVDDAQDLDEAVFEKMWNVRIQPERLEELKQLVEGLGGIVDAILLKAEWITGRIKQIEETRLGQNELGTTRTE